MSSVRRELPTRQACDLLALTRELVAEVLAPRAAAEEQRARFARDVLRTLGEAGLLGLPYDREYGGGGQPYLVYLQVVEELATAWLTVAESVSVHVLSCYPLATYGSNRQRQRWLPDMVGGDLLGAYCLSEPQAGSDPGSLRTVAVREGDGPDAGYVVHGVKSWITHAGVADSYNLMVRTGEPGPRGISCLLAPAGTAGLSAAPREKLLGLRGSPVAQVHLDGVRVPADRLLGQEGQGFAIAMSALDGGRLGIAACAVGLAQAALDVALNYATEREQFGRVIADFQGMAFLLADMATAVEAGRAMYLAAARLRDAGQPYAKQASMAKLFCSDMAMRVTTDAVQVLGGHGYTEARPDQGGAVTSGQAAMQPARSTQAPALVPCC